MTDQNTTKSTSDLQALRRLVRYMGGNGRLLIIITARTHFIRCGAGAGANLDWTRR